MESSPWGTADDDYPLPLPLPRPPSPLPSFGASTSPVTGGGGWGDDGGWGTAVDDYSSASAGGFGSSTASGLEESTEDLDDVETPASPETSFGGGWGVARSPPTHSIDLRAKSPPPLDDSQTTPRPPSPPGFAPSPPLSPVARPSSPPLGSPTADEPAPEAEESGGGWGGHGSPDLPPIASLKLKPESPTDTRASGWGGDEEWTPPEIPVPLPSFGDAFGAPKRAEDEDKEEGWGGGDAVPSWSLAGHEVETTEQEEEPREWTGDAAEGGRRGKSIPASLVDGLKRDSREFGHSTWPVSQESWGQGGFQEQPGGGLSEPPTLPPPSPTSSNPPITNDTPLSSLFKLTSTTFPNFQNGITQTAARSAETLKGTSSAAYRNARFGGGGRSSTGRTSIEGSTGGRGQAGDEYDVDAPGAAKPKSSWWGASGGQTQDSQSVGVPDPAQVERERVTESPDPAPSAIGRFFNRIKRPTNNPVTQAPSRPSVEKEPEEPEWNPRDLDALDAPTSRIARAKQEEAQMDDSLSDFFGDTRKTARVPTMPPVEEFGGLMGAFADAPRKVSKPVVKKSNKALDPFDPFGDDDDEVAAAAPTMVPIVVNSPSRSSTPRVASSSPRPHTPQSPHRATPEPSVASFPSALAAPQARGVSSLTSNTYDSTGNDSFDAFFSSMAPAVKASSAPPLVSPPIAPTRPQATAPRLAAQAPARISTLSPPPRSSTISPSSASPLSALAPPPPPSQPLNRGGFNIAPPPPSSSSLLHQRPLAAPSAPVISAVKPSAPKPSTSGALSAEDWAFFEG